MSLIALFCFEQIPYFIAPDPRSLPSIPENVSMAEMETRQVPKGGYICGIFVSTQYCVCSSEELDGVDCGSRCGEPASALRQHAVRETHSHLRQQTQHCMLPVISIHSTAQKPRNAVRNDAPLMDTTSETWLLAESVSICSWRLACTRWVLYCIPCTGSTSSSPCCHHVCWTTAGKIARHLFLCSLGKIKKKVYLRFSYGCSAPMPYLIGVHTSLSEVMLQF